MKKTVTTIAVIAPLALAVSVALAAGREPASKEKPKEMNPINVTAVATSAAPVLDGDARDAAWKSAPATKFEAVQGYNFKGGKGKSSGTLQVAYDKENVYLRLEEIDEVVLLLTRAVANHGKQF